MLSGERTGYAYTDDLSPAPHAWSRADIPLHALALLENRSDLDDAVAASVAAVHRAAPAIPIVVGGQAVPDAARARALGADEWSGPDIHAALDTIERLAGPACRTAGRPPGPA